jgi:hypothetical protein
MILDHGGDVFKEGEFQKRFTAKKADLDIAIRKGVMKYKIKRLSSGIHGHDGVILPDIAIRARQVALKRGAEGITTRPTVQVEQIVSICGR